MTQPDLHNSMRKAISSYWNTLSAQRGNQQSRGTADQGARSAVTGGSQMNGIINLVREIISASGVPDSCIHYKKALELPGFFRPTKEWDLLVVRDGQLIAAFEAKSQCGPSFGNNFNNRTEEAMGSALDLWTAFREGAFNRTIRPWLGYFFMLEDCEASRKPVRVSEPHFKVFPEFHNASYAKRYELFCRRLLRERHYSAATFLLSPRDQGINGVFTEPAEDLSFEILARSLTAQLIVFGTK
jgi:hypothetical protein